MRALWVSHLIPYPPKSGVHLRSYHLLRGVARRYEVDLVAFIQEPWLRVFFESRAEALAECEQALRSLCRSVRFVVIEKLNRRWGKWRTALESLVLPRPYTVQWLQSARVSGLLHHLAASESYSVAHFDTLGLAPYRSIFACTPATLGHHNIESQVLLRRAEREPRLLTGLYFRQEGWRVRHYEALCAAQFAAHITCSELDSERLRVIAPNAHAVAIPNGVDVEYFRADRTRATSASLIFVGSLNWYPNVEAVLFLLGEIWPLIKAEAPGVRLDIVGSAPPAPVFEAAAQLKDVTVHGFVDDVRPLMNAATVYACPIRDGGGTKLKLLDAFAMEQCVVAHPVACEGLTVTPGVHVELADTARSFADAILRLLREPARRESMGRAARRLVEDHYSFDEIGERLCEVLKSAAGTRG